MTATYPPRAELRECRLYRFYVTHPLTGRVVLGYVGETGRQPFERLLEHLATQPWFDTVVRWEVDPQVYYGKKAVLAAERSTIGAERPLYNVAGNERNRDRVPPPVAIRQRRARDAARGVQRWVHPDDRGGQVRAQPPQARPVKVESKPWRPWQKHALGVGVAEALLTVASWIVLAVKAWWFAEAWWVVPAAVSVLVVWCWLGCPLTEKQWGRRWRKAKRRLR